MGTCYKFCRTPVHSRKRSLSTADPPDKISFQCADRTHARRISTLVHNQRKGYVLFRIRRKTSDQGRRHVSTISRGMAHLQTGADDRLERILDWFQRQDNGELGEGGFLFQGVSRTISPANHPNGTQKPVCRSY